MWTSGFLHPLLAPPLQIRAIALAAYTIFPVIPAERKALEPGSMIPGAAMKFDSRMPENLDPGSAPPDQVRGRPGWHPGNPETADLPSLPRGGRFVRRQFIEHRLEILGLAKVAIDGGKTHIGDVVELAQMLHDDLADGLRRDVALAHALELAHDLRHHLVDALGLDRP